MGLKSSGADRLLTTGFLKGNTWAGLLYDNSGTKTEISGNGYARVARTLADWQRDGASARYENDGAFLHPAVSTANWPAITDAALWSVATGGTPFATVEFDSATDAPQVGQQVRWQDEMAKWGVTSGGITVAGSVAMLTEGLVGGTRAISFHSATPSNTNRLGDSVSVTSADFTADSPAGERRIRNNKRIATPSLSTDVAVPTHVALRDGTGATAGILWTGAVTGNPSDPSVDDVLSIATNALSFQLTVEA